MMRNNLDNIKSCFVKNNFLKSNVSKRNMEINYLTVARYLFLKLSLVPMQSRKIGAIQSSKLSCLPALEGTFRILLFACLKHNEKSTTILGPQIRLTTTIGRNSENSS